jgi:hypothetical protein
MKFGSFLSNFHVPTGVASGSRPSSLAVPCAPLPREAEQVRGGSWLGSEGRNRILRGAPESIAPPSGKERYPRFISQFTDTCIRLLEPGLLNQSGTFRGGSWPRESLLRGTKFPVPGSRETGGQAPARADKSREMARRGSPDPGEFPVFSRSSGNWGERPVRAGLPAPPSSPRLRRPRGRSASRR